MPTAQIPRLTDQPVEVSPGGLIYGLHPRVRGSWTARHPRVVQLVSVVIFLAAWEIYGNTLNPIFLSGPSKVAAAFVELVASGELLIAAASSLGALSIGFSISILAGIAIGILMGRFQTFFNVLDPFITALYNTPSVALIPLIQLWFGLGLEAKVVIVILSAFFPIVINTYAGVRHTGRGMVDVARAYGANDRQVMTMVILPSALPFIMAGMRLAVGRAVIGIVVAEFFTAVNGLGGMIIVFSNSFATAKLFVPVITLVALGLALTAIARGLERYFASWKETERAS